MQGDSVDVRLLTGLVQDVWDKYIRLKESMQVRQRHEAEALWLVQQELWKQRQSELGKYTSEIVQYSTIVVWCEYSHHPHQLAFICLIVMLCDPPRENQPLCMSQNKWPS